MKAVKLFFMAVLIFLTLSLNGWVQESEISKNDSGKVVGCIYDYESNKLVTEQYAISLVPYFSDKKPSPRDCYSFITNKNGYFSNKVKSGKYFITFMPYEENSKYASDLNPIDYPEKAMIINVKKGQITKIRKTVYAGGTLKVILVDNLGQKINPFQFFERFNIFIYLENITNTFSFDCSLNDNEINTGEKVIFGMIPGEYRIGTLFHFSGYGYKENEVINIESKKETIYRIYIDPNDSTGVQGYIKDQSGNPVFSEIEVLNNDENILRGYANVTTDQNGFYKIIGLKKGIYKFKIDGKADKLIKNIKIEKDIILTKDIIINIDETSNIK